MKQKKYIHILIATLLFIIGGMQAMAQSFTVENDGLPAKPNPPVAISDYAGVIDNDLKNRYEKSLDSLEAATKISVVVVTIPTIGDKFGSIEDYATKLFNKWGIGHIGADNGILLLCSMQEHKVRIEVGKGLEEFLTDKTSGMIIDNEITSYFKAGDMRAGFDHGIASLINYTATKIPSAEQRRLIAQQHEAEAKKVREQLESVAFALGLAVLIAFLFYLAYRAQKSLVKRKMKKADRVKAQLLFKNINEELRSVPPAMEKAKLRMKDFPGWAQKEAAQYIDEANRLIEEIVQEMAQIAHLIHDTPEDAINHMNALHVQYTQARAAFEKGMRAIPAKIESFEQNAPELKKQIQQQLNDLLSLLQSYKNDGWRIFEDNLQEAELIKKDISAIEALIDAKAICDACKATMQKISFQGQAAQKEYQMWMDNSTRIDVLKNTKDEVLRSAEKAEQSFAYLKANAPKAIWGSLEGNIARAINGVANIPEKIALASKYNTKEEQKLVECDSILDSIDDAAKRNNALLQDILDRHQQWTAAALAIDPARTVAQEKIADLLKEVKHSDVSSSTRNEAKQLSSRLETANNNINLIIALAALQQIAEEAINLTAKAKKEIKRAKDNRSSSSYSSSSLSSSSWTSMGSGGGGFSSGGGFGGFGGGMSGGGGATGSW